jgi:protein-disulfide isomerase-like protein with CxxC motif
VLTREWLPLALLVAPLNRRVRTLLLAAFLVDSLPACAAARAPADLARTSALHALDRAAYAAGMWREMAATHDFRALRPGPPARSGEG